MEVLPRNPCDAVQRPHVAPSIPRGLAAGEIRRLLGAIPETATGARLRAAVLTLTLTGRRRLEVLELRAKDIVVAGEVAMYSYRGKGAKTGRRELPTPALEAIEAMLVSEGRPPLAELPPEERLFTTTQHSVYLSARRAMKRAGLPAAGLHIFRHAAAKLRRPGREHDLRPPVSLTIAT